MYSAPCFVGGLVVLLLVINPTAHGRDRARARLVKRWLAILDTAFAKGVRAHAAILFFAWQMVFLVSPATAGAIALLTGGCAIANQRIHRLRKKLMAEGIILLVYTQEGVDFFERGRTLLAQQPTLASHTLHQRHEALYRFLQRVEHCQARLTTLSAENASAENAHTCTRVAHELVRLETQACLELLAQE